jgi:tripartite-type tricarboxylate transporter receptor subunit TctC
MDFRIITDGGEEMKEKVWISFAIVLIVLGLGSFGFSQERYPERQIQLIVPYGPGGSTDLCVRSFMGEVAKVLKQPVSIVNRPGAGGLTGADAVANSKPDGYTLLATSAGVLTWGVALDPKSARELDPIAIMAVQPCMITTRTESAFKTLEDVINAAKKKPGGVTCGSSGIQAETYLDLALLEAATGIHIKHIPISNSSEGATNLLGGHIDLWVGSVATTQNLMKAGRLRGLAVSTLKRMRDFPDVPTFSEKGFPQVNVNLVIVMMGPKGLSPAVTKAWEDGLGAVLARQDTVSALNRVNYEVDFQTGPDKLRKYFNDEIKRFSGLAKEKGLVTK